MKNEKNIEDFNLRVKKAMDLIVYKSVNIHLAVSVFAISSSDGISMLNHIKSNL